MTEDDDLPGPDGVDPRTAVRAGTGATELDELLAPDLERPVVAVLRVPGVGQPLQGLRVRHAYGGALDHDVLSCVPAVRAGAPGRHSHVRVAVEVALLLLVWSGAEREGAVQPYAHERYRVRPPVRPDSDDPVELRILEKALDVGPRRRVGRRLPVSRV